MTPMITKSLDLIILEFRTRLSTVVNKLLTNIIHSFLTVIHYVSTGVYVTFYKVQGINSLEVDRSIIILRTEEVTVPTTM